MMDVDLAPIFFVLMISTTAVQSQIQKGPANALRKVGDSVTLECVTSSSNCDQVVWTKMEGAQSPQTVYKDGIGILIKFPRERYSVNSSDGCNLTITQLQINDSGRFSCVITVDDREVARSSVLFVISVNESCLSNVTNSTLNQDDGYSFSTVINVPPKSVEPSNVILSFQNMTVYERETTDDSQPQTVNTTLIGKAGKKNTTQHVCRVSLSPNTAANFDRTTATLDACTTQELIVSHPVQNITVSPLGPYYKGARVTCTAEGYPYVTLKWTNFKSGGVVGNGNILVIDGEAGDKYNCTATNTLTGTTLNITIEVVSPPTEPDPGSGSDGQVAVIVIVIIIIILVVIWLVCWKRGWWPLWFCFPCLLKKDGDINGLCCACCTCFSIAFCAICPFCTYFACCLENKARAEADGKSAEQPPTETVSSKPAEPLTNSTTNVSEKPLTEVVVSSEAPKPVTNSTTTVPEKPLTEVVESSKPAEPLTNSTTTVPERPLTNSTTTVPEKPLTDVAESSEPAEPLTNSTATGPQKPPRVSYSAPTDVISTSQTEARTSGQ